MSKRQRKSGSSSRKIRRVIQKAGAKGNGSSSFVTADRVNAVAQQLNDNQSVLGRLINETNAGVLKAFTIQDAHLHVMRRVINDLAKGGMQLEEDGTEIAWSSYYREYEKAKIAIALMMWIKKMLEVLAPKTEQKQEGEEDFVFGGDYAHSHNTAG